LPGTPGWKPAGIPEGSIEDLETKGIGVVAEFFEEAPVDAEAFGAMGFAEDLEFRIVACGTFMMEPFHES
jgi:hypothetical protein